MTCRADATEPTTPAGGTPRGTLSGATGQRDRAGTGDVGTRPVRALRALPVPVNEPHPVRSARRGRPGVPVTQGALALAFTTVERSDDAGGDPHFGPRATSSRDLPDPAAASAALVRAVVEVLAGSRPSAQLARWLATDVYVAVQRRAALAARLRRGAAPANRHAVVRRVRVCEPRDGVVEACAVVLDSGRVRAVALRLEGIDGRWRATAVEVG